MAKLHLKLEELDVESFETSKTQAKFGTVRAHDGTRIECPPDSNLVSCGGSCDFTSCDDHTCYGCGETGTTCPTRNQFSCVQTGPAPDTCCRILC
ncbi:MAG TPA: hypothetical protein VGX50_16175 [Longimicrobium sp.]|nr:hypothetical protein [Longimicrobium sp.]